MSKKLRTVWVLKHSRDPLRGSAWSVSKNRKRINPLRGSHVTLCVSGTVNDFCVDVKEAEDISRFCGPIGSQLAFFQGRVARFDLVSCLKVFRGTPSYLMFWDPRGGRICPWDVFLASHTEIARFAGVDTSQVLKCQFHSNPNLLALERPEPPWITRQTGVLASPV